MVEAAGNDAELSEYVRWGLELGRVTLEDVVAEYGSGMGIDIGCGDALLVRRRARFKGGPSVVAFSEATS